MAPGSAEEAPPEPVEGDRHDGDVVVPAEDDFDPPVEGFIRPIRAI